jgi:hypothetical protein
MPSVVPPWAVHVRIATLEVAKMRANLFMTGTWIATAFPGHNGEAVEWSKLEDERHGQDGGWPEVP